MMKVPDNALLEEARGLLDRGIEVVMLSWGDEMLPFIKGEKDKLLVKKDENVKKGDVVLARLRDGSNVLRRVYCRVSDNIILRADTSLGETESCNMSDVMGTVMEIIHEDGSVKKTPSAFWWEKLFPVRGFLLRFVRK